MRISPILIILLFILPAVASCHYPAETSSETHSQDSLHAQHERPYTLSSNFKVTTDTLWLLKLPFTDSVPVKKGDELVVAEFSVHPKDSVDSLWVKVARDQETIGWIQEKKLLDGIVPVDPISQCINFFSNSHTLIFLLVLALFLLGVIYRAIRRKQIRLIWLNDIDSVFPITLSWLLATAAVIYNSIQHFVPETWEQYYYSPSLNPFELPFVLGLFVLSVWLIMLLGVALLDDLFHQTTIEMACFYLIGLASCCIILYVFLTYLWIYMAYICFAAYTAWCANRLRNANRYPYACGACGAKMRSKGICPHCGAINE